MCDTRDDCRALVAILCACPIKATGYSSKVLQLLSVPSNEDGDVASEGTAFQDSEGCWASDGVWTDPSGCPWCTWCSSTQA